MMNLHEFGISDHDDNHEKQTKNVNFRIIYLYEAKC
jgi:hypothetical protein